MKNQVLLSLAALMSLSAAAPAMAWDRDWDGRYDRGRHYGHRYYAPTRVVVVQPSRDVVYAQPVTQVVQYQQPAYQTTRVVCRDSFNPVTGIIGGALGGVAGNGIGRGHGRTAAIITGAVLGTTIGGSAGGRNCAEEVVAQPAVVQANYTQNYADNDTQGRYCREYQNRSTVGGRVQETYGTACMQPDGSWEIVN